MAFCKLPDACALRNVLQYDGSTGSLTWSSIAHGKIGAEAGFVDRKGYRLLFVAGGRYLAHRVIWKMVTGEDPQFIDHINGDPGDNRWENLRSVDRNANNRNKAVQKNNKSGVSGVRLKDGRWVAEIKYDGRIRHLRSFADRQHAIVARAAAEKVIGYHPNHGRPSS